MFKPILKGVTYKERLAVKQMSIWVMWINLWKRDKRQDKDVGNLIETVIAELTKLYGLAIRRNANSMMFNFLMKG